MSSRKLQYSTLDVFTNTRYVGNPLGLVKVPSSLKLTQDEKQLIAREFNYSETVFVHERPDPSVNEWTVDIFLTSKEIPFAGHPTIGTACYVFSELAAGASSGTYTGAFNVKAGKIQLVYDAASRFASASIPHNVNIHKMKFSFDALSAVHPELKAGSFTSPDSAPIVSIVNGMTFALPKLNDLNHLAAVKTARSKLSTDGLDADWSDTLFAVYFYVDLPDKVDEVQRLRTRLISGSLEDPATGSAVCQPIHLLLLSRQLIIQYHEPKNKFAAIRIALDPITNNFLG